MYKCIYCNHFFTTKTGRGIHTSRKHKQNVLDDKNITIATFLISCYACGKKFKNNASAHAHLARCTTHLALRNIDREKYLTYDFLYENFIQNDYTGNYIATKVINSKYISTSDIITAAKKLGIQTKNFVESANNTHRRARQIKTCQQRFGTINPLSNGSPCIEKRNKTVRERYSVDNVFQYIDFIKKIQDDQHYIEKYGMPLKELRKKQSHEAWERCTDEQKNAWLLKSIHSINSCRKVAGYGPSKLETEVQNVLNDLNITYTRQYHILMAKRKWVFIDFFIPKIRLLIEVQGDYWHANPKQYYNTDIIHYKPCIISAEDIWAKDQIRKELLQKKGYKYLEIWESDIISNRNNETLQSFVLQEIQNAFKD